MKIGVVRRGYSDTGGAESYLKRFAAEAVAQGHECVLFTAEWPREQWPYGELVPLMARSRRDFADELQRVGPYNFCDFLFSLERVWSCDCYRAGDGVHRSWLAQSAKREPVWKSWFYSWQPRHREILQLEKKLFTPEATPLIITNSKRIKGEISDTYGYPAAQIQVIYNGLPAPKFDPTARERLRREMGFAVSDYIAVFVGSGWERKGLKFAISAVNRVTENMRLIVLGRGNPRKYPKSSRVHFLGASRQVNDWLLAADVFVLPTLYDPFSNASLEALGAGLPVITSAANGVSEIINEGVHGSVIDEPSNITALAEKIEFWRDPQKRRAANDEAKRLAAEFNIEKNVRETLELIDQKP